MIRPQITFDELKSKYIDKAQEILHNNLSVMLTAEQITQADFEKYSSKSLIIAEPVYVVAIRGYYRDTMGREGINDFGIYDDCFCLVAPNYYKTFNANTDPSKQKKDISTLIPGLHYFKQGLHGFNRPTPPYKAFRPDTPDESLPVVRHGQVGVKQAQYINIHRGGEQYTNSAGCQTTRPEQYSEWQTNAYTLMNNEGQKRLPYLLLST